MTRELYEEVKEYINSLEWHKFSFNFGAILASAKSKFNLTEEDLLDYEGFSHCDVENEHEQGFLKGYECNICNNRGYNNYHEVKDGKIYYYVKNCICKKIRLEYQRLEACGIHKTLLEKYTLPNYYPEYPWQKRCKDVVTKYIEECNASKKFNKWLIISGQSGTGKSHLCTSVYKELLINGRKVRYMPWKDATDRLMKLKDSNYSESQKKYETEMSELKTIEVLYIDDFLKLLPDGYKRNDVLELAYMIINARYSNGLITIISTEEMIDDIKNIDSAICGRIKERAKDYCLQIKKEDGRDQRM